MPIFTPTLLGRLLQLVPRNAPAPLRYLGAALLIGMAAAIRLSLDIDSLPYLLFIPFIMTAAFWFGLGPGVFATLLSVLLAETLFVKAPAYFALFSERWVSHALFVFVNIVMAVVCAAQRRSLESLYRFAGVLDEQVTLRTRQRDLIWQASPDLLCTASPEGRLLDLNPAWTATLGWTAEELRREPFMAFVHADDRERTEVALKLLLAGEPVFGFENRYRHRTGGYRWFSWNAVLQDGLIYATVREVTAIREQQEALQQAEEQLRQSQKMEAVGQLTGGIAHDFNNLLTGVIGSLDLLSLRLDQGRFGDLQRYASAAKGAAERAAALTQRLLAFSRRQDLEPTVTHANELVVGMAELIRHSVGSSIQIHTELAEDLHLTLCDPHQLENALLNLCINARDAMPGGGLLRIVTANRRLNEVQAAALELPAGDYVTLAVLDTGSGMPPEVLARAFDPFFTTKPVGMGTGLGLSMIYGFARQSGGLAQLASLPEVGTTVTLYLPRLLAEPVQPVKAPSPAPAQPAPGRTVLVVDDERLVRMLVDEGLREHGFTTLQATDGAAALQVLESAIELDLLITDVGLPGDLSGCQLATLARARRPALEILLITGYAEAQLPGESAALAGVEVLAKPFTLGRLLAQIDLLLSRRGNQPPR
ncbi:hybrid sensor histidine kinase/response regulator [Pseudomonas sp. EpS/L25]|uniref:hybrid sensor histidine kinase/response regulator n=1 Tax=Pseudomonas sp. EpS/L25 TaxID=1749078 RepID=UPI000743EE1C|nr:response regulator [Pseudomonas sp. EpS/L25]KUM43898.1 hybrid sensor histidine kinase/response regulator [Pseudomonas sp. EpS/L25]